MPGISRTLRRAVLLSLTLLPATVGEARATYLPTADRLQVHLNEIWSADRGYYDPGPGATTTQVNGALLLVHSVAALHGHAGPARNDQRARQIARFLTGPQIWTDRPRPGAEPEIRGPGWRAAPDFPSQHPVFEVEAADGLASAYLARDVLGLDAATVEAIRTQIARVATGPDFAWPALRLNQHNWNSSILAAHATVNGRDDVLADGLRRHLARFTGMAADNFGGGLRFHYLPHRPPEATVNVDSPEYANIVLGFSRHYGQARRAGMPEPAQLGLLRDWVRRVVAGYWTHGGYLNWDTGLGFHRWHQRKKVALAQLALLGVATEPGLQPAGEWGAWARWMFDRGLEQLHRPGRALREDSPLAGLRRQRAPAEPRHGVPDGRALRRQRDASAAGGPAGPPVGAAAAAVRLRPGHGPARDHHARVQHGDRGRSTRAPSRTAGSTSRACSTRDRRWPRTSAAWRRRRSACAVRAGRTLLADPVRPPHRCPHRCACPGGPSRRGAPTRARSAACG